MRRFINHLALLILSTTALVLSRPAQAILGADINSVEKDRAMFSAVRSQPELHENYAVHELNSAAGKVREFATPEGVVFCITYLTVTQPDLPSLMGSYSDDFKSASAKSIKRPGRRAYAAIEGNHVKLERYGHPRALRGRICATDLIPSGVNLNELR
jgi:Protein of unknown function (DUF2844)